jgi:GTP cyclohydrolase II
MAHAQMRPKADSPRSDFPEVSSLYSAVQQASAAGGAGVSVRDEAIAILRDDLLRDALLRLPPHLDAAKCQADLTSLYLAFLHVPTGGLAIANKGATLLARSSLSKRLFPVFHLGFVVYFPEQGIEVIDVGITGDIAKSELVVVRTESACSPSFVFGSQRCNCHDQWLVAQELACEYNEMQVADEAPETIEATLRKAMTMSVDGQVVSRLDGRPFIAIHLASQNGMGSGVTASTPQRDLTATAFMRHRGEYSAEQIMGVSMARAFTTLGMIPDPRRLNECLSYRAANIVLDLVCPKKKIIALTNNPLKVEGIQTGGYAVHRIGLIARKDVHCHIETQERRDEFGHIIPSLAPLHWKKEFSSIKTQLDALFGGAK